MSLKEILTGRKESPMNLYWEDLGYSNYNYSDAMYRSKVPGGWLIMVRGSTAPGLTFLPDPNHKWDGNSLP